MREKEKDPAGKTRQTERKKENGLANKDGEVNV